MKYRSADILEKNSENGPYRCLFKAMGYTDFELSGRPVVGIANSWNTAVPGHYNLRELGEFVKKGIYSNGGTAVEFGVIAACDGVADGHVGMNYILPSRETICNSIEIQAQTTKLDALVLLASCDKIVPAMLMAAARLDLPAIIVTGGPMSGGIEFDGRKSDSTTIDEAIGMRQVGKVTEEELLGLEDLVCPTCGSCAFLGTANTMGCVTEALGMCLPGGGLIPATYAERRRLAFSSGQAICDLARNQITARRIITRQSVRNAIRAVMAICGSTNAVLHLSAVANEAELPIRVVDEFRELNLTTPQIAKVNPAAKWDMEAFHLAGGIPRVMKNLGSLIDRDALTCTGKTVGENLDHYPFTYPQNPEIIRTLDDPFSDTGGIAVLSGNLAPNTAVTKPGAFAPSLAHFVGKARVFDSEASANSAILAGEIEEGSVIVIRYEGPKGGPGMREMYKAMKYLYGMGMGEKVALITDGRFSGTNNGCFVGHISPEAAEGGPIAAVQDGDEILIDVNEGKLELHVSDAEIERRLRQVKPPMKDIPKGYLRLYAKVASSADRGAVIDA